MKRVLAVVTLIAVTPLLAGCGGGGAGSTTLAKSASTDSRARTGTVRFNLLPVAVMTIIDDNGSVFTPVNPPQDAFEGEAVRFTFVEAQNPPFVRPEPQPIELLSFGPK